MEKAALLALFQKQNNTEIKRIKRIGTDSTSLKRKEIRANPLNPRHPRAIGLRSPSCPATS